MDSKISFGAQVSREEARARFNMLANFIQSPGWHWLKENVEKSLRVWEEALESTPPVGEGAALLARAQGARLALRQVLVLPENSMKGYQMVANDVSVD